MGDWLTAAELKERYGEARIESLADRDGDGVEDAGVVDAAIDDAEGRARSELLSRFAASELPTVPGDATPTLKRIVAKLAYYFMHERFDIIGEGVIRERDDALAELRAVRRGATNLALSDAPAVDTARGVVVVSRRPAGVSEQALTLSRMDRWGR